MPKFEIENEELKLWLAFGIGLLLWLFLGVPALTTVVSKYGIILAYSIWLMIYVGIAYILGRILTGDDHEELIQRVLFLVLGFFVSDLWAPPILIPFAGPTTLVAEQQISSDVFVYTIGKTVLGLPHTAAWFFTYLIVPFAIVGILALLLRKTNFFQAFGHIGGGV